MIQENQHELDDLHNSTLNAPRLIQQKPKLNIYQNIRKQLNKNEESDYEEIGDSKLLEEDLSNILEKDESDH